MAFSSLAFAARLAPTTRAALWVVFGGVCSTIMNVVIRRTAAEPHPFEITFSAACSGWSC